MYYPSIIMVVFLIYGLLLAVVFGVLYVGALELAFKSLGLSQPVVLGVLLISLLGSYINIPLMQLESEPKKTREKLNIFGQRFYFPTIVRRPKTVLAVNVGGCLVPVLLSTYLIYNHVDILVPLSVATGFVSIIVNLFSKPVEGIGVTVPLLLPPLVAVFIALSLTGSHSALVAYVSGTLGTIVGADLMNLHSIRNSRAPVVSIGGAGTFDGVFLTGILAVLLASITA